MNRCLPRPIGFSALSFEQEVGSFLDDVSTFNSRSYADVIRKESPINYWNHQNNDWQIQYEKVCQQRDFFKSRINELESQASKLTTQHAKESKQRSTLESQVSKLEVKVTKLKALWKSDCKLRKKLWTTIKSLRAELEEKIGIISSQKQQLFGKKSEKGVFKSETNPSAKNTPKRPRGQQKGSRGHGRTENKDLPVQEEVMPLSQTACEHCGEEYDQLPDEESSVLAVDVKAYRRLIKRQKFAKNCSCPGAEIITAPAPKKLLLKNPYDISIWESLLRQKFLEAQPINRILNYLKCLGVQISPGSVAGGLKKLAPLFKELYDAFYKHQMKETRFHNDESPWRVFEQVKDKIGNRYYLWLTLSKDVVFFLIDPTRSADVPLKHFSKLVLDKIKQVIVICDRYSAYFKLARLNPFIILAFCWAHVRRDFLKIANSYPNLATWGLEWVNEIGNFYHLNKERLSQWNEEIPFLEQSSAFKEKHKALETALTQMKTRCDALFEADQKSKKEKVRILEPSQRKALKSLRRCWKGLTVFLEHPEVPMDNNPAERSIRNPVIGRKNYYGSGSLWSADLAAMMFTIFQTILRWKINPRTYLTRYLEACAQNNGKAPENVEAFLPWKMSEARLEELRKPLPRNSS